MTMSAVNKETMRAISEVGFGYACYTGTRVSEDAITETIDFRHSGLVGTTTDAKKWLAGRNDVRLIRMERHG
jgi:hypothetical protein